MDRFKFQNGPNKKTNSKHLGLEYLGSQIRKKSWILTNARSPYLAILLIASHTWQARSQTSSVKVFSFSQVLETFDLLCPKTFNNIFLFSRSILKGQIPHTATATDSRTATGLAQGCFFFSLETYPLGFLEAPETTRRAQGVFCFSGKMLPLIS